MNKFNLKIIYFILPLALIAIVIELAIRQIPNDYSYKKKYLDNTSNSIEVLFLGSSHTYYGINPKFVAKKSFNASHISQSLDYDYEILKKYENNWNQLKLIVLPIDYLTFFNSVSTGVEQWRVKNYNIYYDINITNTTSDNFEFLNTKPKLIFKRMHSYYFKKKSEITCSKLGHSSIFNPTNNLEENGYNAAIRHTNITKQEFKKNIAILNKIIDFGNKHNIQLLFYTSPAYTTYVKNLNQIQLDLTINSINRIIDDNSNCFYYNLLEDSTFIKTDYMDADHLNYFGAQKLSLKLNKYINEIKHD